MKLKVRIVSTFLALLFSLEQLSFASGEIKPIRLDFGGENYISWAKKILPAIPESEATIEDAWKGENSPFTIYLFQDAHTNESGQVNLAKTLDILFQEEKGLKYIFVEAGVGDDSLSFLRKYSSLQKRKEVATEYLKKGILHGEEYLDLTSDHDFVIWGVEDFALYQKAIDAYRSVVKDREKFQHYLSQIQTTIDTLKPRIFNPGLLSFDEKYTKFLKENISLTEYFQILIQEAKKRNTPLLNYPHLQSLNNLKEKESKIDFKKANEEQQRAIQSLSQNDQKELLEYTKKESPFKLGSNEHKEEKAFYTLLEEKLGKAVDQYPELSKYLAYLKEAKVLNPKKILEEQKQLENEIFNVLAKTPDEQTLIHCQTNLRSLQKLFDLKLTPEEYAEYKGDSKNFTIRHLTGFLNKKIMDLQNFYKKAAFLKEGYDNIVKNSETFYELTKDRDKVFLRTLSEKMRQEKQTKAVLITGGFHTTNLKTLFKEKNISFVSIMPQVYQETNQKRYESLLLNQKIDSNLLASAPPYAQSMARLAEIKMTPKYLSAVSLALNSPQKWLGFGTHLTVPREVLVQTPIGTLGARMASKSNSEWIARANDTNSHEDLLQILDDVSHSENDLQTKLDIAARVMIQSPHFLGNKEPFFVPYPSQVFSQYAYEVDKTRKDTDVPFTILSYGVGDGRRLYEISLFLRALGVRNVRFVGIEYQNEAIEQVINRIPDMQIFEKNLLDWNDTDTLFQLLKGKVHIIDSSFLLHEIYSFGGRNSAGDKTIDHAQGVSKVVGLLKESSKLLSVGGIAFIVDGYLTEDVQKHPLVLSQEYTQAYKRLRRLYEPYVLPEISNIYDDGRSLVYLTRSEIDIFLDKSTFFSSFRRRPATEKRIEREMRERLAFWTEGEWLTHLQEVGFYPIFKGKYRHWVYHQRDVANISDQENVLPNQKPYGIFVSIKDPPNQVILQTDKIDEWKPVFVENTENDPRPRIRAYAREVSEALATKFKKRGVVLIDGPSGSGKTVSSEAMHKVLPEFGVQSSEKIVPLDIFLVDPKAREEKESSIVRSFSPTSPYLQVEDEFYRSKEMQHFLEDVISFVMSEGPQEKRQFIVEKAYDRKSRSMKPMTFEFSRGDVIVVEGQYAFSLSGISEKYNGAEFRLRILDNAEKTKKLFEKRTRELNSQRNDLEIFMSARITFYDVAIVPSWEVYRNRTMRMAEWVLDFRNENSSYWTLRSSENSTEIENEGTHPISQIVLGKQIEGARLSNIIPTLHGESPITENKAISFLAQVHVSTNGQTGTLIIDHSVFSIEEKDNEIIFLAFGKEIFKGDKTRVQIVAKEGEKTAEVTLSMGDLKLFVQEAYKAIDEFSLNEPVLKALNDKNAVAVVDLDHLAKNRNDSLNDLIEIAIPALIREAVRSHGTPEGKNAVVLIQGNEALLDVVNKELSGLKDRSFIVTDEKELPEGYQDPKQRITITSPNEDVKKGVLYFFLQAIERGDVPNFHAAFKIAFTLARIDKLEASSKELQEILRLFEFVLGRPIENKQELISVLQGQIQNSTIQALYALGNIVRIPIDKIVQGARLTLQVIGRAA